MRTGHEGGQEAYNPTTKKSLKRDLSAISPFWSCKSDFCSNEEYCENWTLRDDIKGIIIDAAPIDRFSALYYRPPGCGKTLIAKAVANEAGANFIHIKWKINISINDPELLNKKWGESEKAVRTLFSRARACTPCILFFDEVCGDRGEQGVESVEILLNQLLVELDSGEKRKGVIVIGATNRPDLMDPAVLRPGRFGKHMYVPLPNKDERGFILKALASNKPMDSSVNLSEIGQRTACEKFTRADLAALMHEAAMAAVEEKLTSLASWGSSPCIIKQTHFEQALAKITPSLGDKDLQDSENFRKQQGKWTSKRKARKGEHVFIFLINVIFPSNSILIFGNRRIIVAILILL
ncbi:hypothetical protein Prudu_015426 [Prunus dulcis]|uniref:AAA+ ATPase domain-containing protein n=1 Tax=Prunus dulcis TaxID=3755 RepID=A0A4Y1RJB1_PRUDU|nr:hypothetical protein Prudu_015426 [Prunus dulcis]